MMDQRRERELARWVKMGAVLVSITVSEHLVGVEPEGIISQKRCQA